MQILDGAEVQVISGSGREYYISEQVHDHIFQHYSILLTDRRWTCDKWNVS